MILDYDEDEDDDVAYFCKTNAHAFLLRIQLNGYANRIRLHSAMELYVFGVIAVSGIVCTCRTSSSGNIAHLPRCLLLLLLRLLQFRRINWYEFSLNLQKTRRRCTGHTYRNIRCFVLKRAELLNPLSYNWRVDFRFGRHTKAIISCERVRNVKTSIIRLNHIFFRFVLHNLNFFRRNRWIDEIRRKRMSRLMTCRTYHWHKQRSSSSSSCCSSVFFSEMSGPCPWLSFRLNHQKQTSSFGLPSQCNWNWNLKFSRAKWYKLKMPTVGCQLSHKLSHIRAAAESPLPS